MGLWRHILICSLSQRSKPITGASYALSLLPQYVVVIKRNVDADHRVSNNWKMEIPTALFISYIMYMLHTVQIRSSLPLVVVVISRGRQELCILSYCIVWVF